MAKMANKKESILIVKQIESSSDIRNKIKNSTRSTCGGMFTLLFLMSLHWFVNNKLKHERL